MIIVKMLLKPGWQRRLLAPPEESGQQVPIAFPQVELIGQFSALQFDAGWV
jgi:hypothetical protein